MRMITQDMYETAVHEAAHAVVASVLRHARRVDHATIQPSESEGALGEVTFLDYPPGVTTTWEHMLAESIVFASGEFATARLTGRQEVFGLVDLTGIAAFGALAKLSAPSGTLPANRALRLAKVPVDLAWLEIEQVAAELLEHTTIYGDRVRQIVAQRWPTGISVANLDELVMKADIDAHEIVMRELRSIATRSRKRSA